MPSVSNLEVLKRKDPMRFLIKILTHLPFHMQTAGIQPDVMVVCTCDPHTGEVEAEGHKF